MRELETSLQPFGEFILKAQLVKEKAAPFCVRWVRRFLTRPVSNEPLADQVRRFCEALEQNGGCQDWQVLLASWPRALLFKPRRDRTTLTRDEETRSRAVVRSHASRDPARPRTAA